MHYMTSLGDDLLMLLPVLVLTLFVGGLYWLACRSFYKTADRQWRMRLEAAALQERLFMERRGCPSDKAFLHGLGFAGFATVVWLSLKIAAL